jgi:hypothetical protein
MSSQSFLYKKENLVAKSHVRKLQNCVAMVLENNTSVAGFSKENFLADER